MLRSSPRAGIHRQHCSNHDLQGRKPDCHGPATGSGIALTCRAVLYDQCYCDIGASDVENVDPSRNKWHRVNLRRSRLRTFCVYILLSAICDEDCIGVAPLTPRFSSSQTNGLLSPCFATSSARAPRRPSSSHSLPLRPFSASVAAPPLVRRQCLCRPCI